MPSRQMDGGAPPPARPPPPFPPGGWPRQRAPWGFAEGGLALGGGTRRSVRKACSIDLSPTVLTCRQLSPREGTGGEGVGEDGNPVLPLASDFAPRFLLLCDGMIIRVLIGHGPGKSMEGRGRDLPPDAPLSQPRVSAEVRAGPRCVFGRCCASISKSIRWGCWVSWLCEGDPTADTLAKRAGDCRDGRRWHVDVTGVRGALRAKHGPKKQL